MQLKKMNDNKIIKFSPKESLEKKVKKDSHKFAEVIELFPNQKPKVNYFWKALKNVSYGTSIGFTGGMLLSYIMARPGEDKAFYLFGSMALGSICGFGKFVYKCFGDQNE